MTPRLIVALIVTVFGWSTWADAGQRGAVLLVLTNHGTLGDSGKPTGFFLEEAAHPWEAFRRAGLEVVLASPRGGFAPVDPKSLNLEDPANAAFWQEFGGRTADGEGVRETVALATVKPGDYAGIFFAGGHGTMWDFADAASVRDVTAAIYEAGGVVGAVCHGPAALVGVKLSSGEPLVKGRRVAPFTDAEEAAVGLTATVPFLLESRLRELGATPMPAANFQENAVRDGRLVTGQNPASAGKTARLFLEAMGAEAGGESAKDQREAPGGERLGP